jgi:hypothetical protein
VIALRTWKVDGRDRMKDSPGVTRAESAQEAVDRALDLL